MKFFERIKLWGKSTGEKAFKVSEYQKAEQALADVKKQLLDVTNACYQSKAENEATKKQLAEYKSKVELCDKKFTEFVQMGPEGKNKAQLVFEKKKSIEITVKSLEATLEVQKTAIARLEKQKGICEKNKVKLENAMNAIKVKERYAEQVDKYQAILDKANINGMDIKDMEFNVDVKFNAADLKMQDLQNAQDDESILDDIEDEGFEAAYKAALETTQKTDISEII